GETGRELARAFAADRARQGEERERRTYLAQHNRQQFERRESSEGELHAAHALEAEGRAQLEALEGQRVALTRFWHYFKRRALERRIGAAQAALEGAQAAVAQAQAQTDETERESAAE